MQKSEFNQVGFDKALVRLSKTQRQSMRLYGSSVDPPTMIGLDTNLSKVLAKEYVEKYGKVSP